jgi:hypothetical protein
MKLKSLLLGALLTFNVSAGHDTDSQLQKNIENMVKTCTENIGGERMIMDDNILFCESSTAVVFYYPAYAWKTCIFRASTYASSVEKIPGCILIVNSQKQTDFVKSLKLEFYRVKVGLYIFRLNIKIHEGLAV